MPAGGGAESDEGRGGGRECGGRGVKVSVLEEWGMERWKDCNEMKIWVLARAWVSRRRHAVTTGWAERPRHETVSLKLEYTGWL